MHARGAWPGRRVEPGEAADLRPREARRDRRAGQVARGHVAAEGRGYLVALGRRRGVHPDRRRAAGEDWPDFVGEGGGGVGVGEGILVPGREVDGPVLLAGHRHGIHRGEVCQTREAVEGELEAVEPQQRIGVHLLLAVRPQPTEESLRMTSVGEVRAEPRAGSGDRRALRRVQHEVIRVQVGLYGGSWPRHHLPKRRPRHNGISTRVVYRFFTPPLPVLVNYRHWPVGISISFRYYCACHFLPVLWFSLDST